MNLWHIRLGSGQNAIDAEKKFRADLANDHSIITIGYSLSKDVRGMTDEQLKKQLNDDNPRGNPDAINNYFTYVKYFRDSIKIDDLVISLFLHPDRKYRIGKVIEEIGTIESLLDSPVESFSGNDESQILARKVKWLTSHLPEDLIDKEIIEKVKSGGIYIGAVAPIKL